MSAVPERTSFAIASMVLAIVSLPASLVVGMGIPFGAAAVLLGILSRRSAKSNLAKFGILVGSIGIAVSCASIVLWFVLWRSGQ